MVLDELKDEFVEQSIHSPGGDKWIADFYRGVVELWENKKLQELLKKVVNKRKIEAKHFVNLFFRAIQYMQLYELERKDYPNRFVGVKDWKQELEYLMDNKFNLLLKILLDKSTVTTVYQRYIGPKAILVAMFGEKELEIADFGCGGNYGLAGMILGEPFEEVKDDTHIINEFAKAKIIITAGLAVDREPYQTPESKKWRLACSFYPGELEKLPNTLNFEERTQNVRNVVFLQKDIRNIGDEAGVGRYDAVIMSTVMYQMPADQAKIYEIARRILKPEGIVIVQDFAAKAKNDVSELKFDTSWFKGFFSYRTFLAGNISNWKMWEIFSWNNGRCREVRLGEDFQKWRTVVKPKERGGDVSVYFGTS